MRPTAWAAAGALADIIPGVKAAIAAAAEEESAWLHLGALMGFAGRSTSQELLDEVNHRTEYFAGRGSTWPRLAAIESVAEDYKAGRIPTP
jgi:hypothetical protein